MNLGLPGVVVSCTKDRMCALVGPSFQEGSGSVCACVCIGWAMALPSQPMRASASIMTQARRVLADRVIDPPAFR
jgi:hypothetical protein